MGTWKLAASVNDPILIRPIVTITDSLPRPDLELGVLHNTLLELCQSDASQSVHPTPPDMVPDLDPKLAASRVTDAPCNRDDPILYPTTLLTSPASYDTASLIVPLCTTAVMTTWPVPPAPPPTLHTSAVSVIHTVDEQALCPTFALQVTSTPLNCDPTTVNDTPVLILAAF